MKMIMTLFILTLMGLPAHAESVYTCTNPQGEVVYTNKQLKGYTCVVQKLPDLSSVPQRTTHTVPSTSMGVSPVTHDDQDPPLIMGEHHTFRINPSVGHNVAEQVCDLYGKWLDLNLKTRGGLYYDPLTAPLLTMFGGGYIPMECRK